MGINSAWQIVHYHALDTSNNDFNFIQKLKYISHELHLYVCLKTLCFGWIRLKNKIHSNLFQDQTWFWINSEYTVSWWLHGTGWHSPAAWSKLEVEQEYYNALTQLSPMFEFALYCWICLASHIGSLFYLFKIYQKCFTPG